MRVAIKLGVPSAQQPGVVISFAPDHHTFGVLQMTGDLGVGLDATIHSNQQVRKVFFELVSQLVTQRRDLAILFGRKTIEPGVAGMHDEHLATGLTHRAHKVAHKVVTFDLVDANAVLHGHWHIDHIEHGFDAIGHGVRLVHQASAKSTALHPV